MNTAPPPPGHQLVVAQGTKADGTVAEQCAVTVDELATLLRANWHVGKLPHGHVGADAVKADKDTRWFSLARFSAPVRNNANVQAIYGFIGDFDKGTWSIEDIIGMLAALGFKFLLYTTYSHSAERPKFRVVVPYAQPVTPADHARLWNYFNQMFEGGLDSAAKDAARLFYFPSSCADTTQLARWHVGDGALFDAAHTLALLPAASPQAEAVSHEWTDAPVPEWGGPADDAELIALALSGKIQTPRQRLGHAATFAELWDGTAAAKWFAGDESGADQSLFNSLAFYTGKDCERMARLIHTAPVAQTRGKDKYNRPDYLRRTILEACAGCNTVLQNRPAPVPTIVETPARMPPGITGVMVLNRKGQYDATLPNLDHVLGGEQYTMVGFDTFRARVMIAPVGTQDWRPITDTDMIQLRETLERKQGFAPIGKEMMRDALQLVAERRSFDSAIVWLKGLTWDGTQRVERFLTDYCGAADDDYTRAVSLYIWTGLANRVLVPGCQLDMVVPLISPQGKRKSTGLQCMVPHEDCFTDGLSLQDDDDNFKRMIRGTLVVEISELAGMSKADVDYVKRVITRRNEVWIEKWQTLETRYPRRCMIFASTNNVQCLPRDDTGQRRWLPVEIVKLDRERITADCAQLWAEGAAIYAERGQLWADAERLAEGRHAAYEQTDVWETDIGRWLSASGLPLAPGGAPLPPPNTRPLTASEVLAGAIHLSPGQMNPATEKRAGSVLRKLGYAARTVRVDGYEKPQRRWVRNL